MRGINQEIIDKIKEQSPKAWEDFLAYIEHWQNTTKCYLVPGIHTFASENEITFENWPFEFQFVLLGEYVGKHTDSDIELVSMRAECESDLLDCFRDIHVTLTKDKEAE